MAIGTAFPRTLPLKYWAVGALCAMLPDLDVVGFWIGIRYGDFLGHRGFTHSLLFAVVVAVVAIETAPVVEPGAVLRWLYIFLATASHGLLDALTNGGHGVAFFAPFDNTRYFFPFRPIVVSPIGLRGIFTSRGLAVLGSELCWVWLPSAAFAGLCALLARQRSAGGGTSAV